MHVMDMTNHEQAAIFRGKGYSDEDYADWAVSIAQIYNKADLCPETNVANGFIVAVNSRRYYHWYYQDKKTRADRIPGVRTTASSKEKLIETLAGMLNRGSIVIHDEETLNELGNFIKIRKDSNSPIKMRAKGAGHDDAVAALWIYAGSLTMLELDRGRKHSFTIL